MRNVPPLSRRAIARLLCLIAALVGALCLPRTVYAVGSVTVTSREPVESDGKWKLNMTIDYGSIPHLPHIPMLFVFTPVTLYERALTDKSPETPVLNKIPLKNQQAINESMDVGFSDASGKTFKTTKFDFVIRRDHGFEAGEYELKIKREDDGTQMGQTIKLTLKGDNPVIDRRAITFAGEKSKKKDKDKDKDSGSAGEKPADGAKKDAAGAPADAAPNKDAATEPPADAPAPPPVPPKQGGCGCKVAGDPAPAFPAAVVLGALGAAVFMRRRRARR